jgi:multiple sugar transport system permease protein
MTRIGGRLTGGRLTGGRWSGIQAREAMKGYAFIAPWVIGFLVFTLTPVVLSLYYSLCDYSLLQPPVFRGLENYRLLLHDKIFFKALINTLYYAAFAVPLGLVVALSVALLLNVNIAGRSIYRTIVFLPSLVPTVAAAMIWLWLLNGKLGLVNLALATIGVRNPPNWLSDQNWAMPSLILMSVWGIGNTIVIYLAGLQDIPGELYEAAELDGAGAWNKTWHVTLPTLSPVIFFNVIMALIGVMQIFILPYIMTQGGPDRATYFFTYYLYDNAFVYLKMGYASAMAWIQLLIVLALTGVAFWSSKHWVHHQGR